MVAAHPERSRSVLEQTPLRALLFLRGVATTPAIYATLAANGYTIKEHEQGWSLLCSVSGYRPGAAASAPSEQELHARNAIAELDAWDEQGFRRAKAALGRLHPEQCAFVFDGLTAAKGPEAVLRVSVFLDRLDALESSAARKSTRKADAAALATLAGRGIDEAERASLRALVKDAQAVPSAPMSPIALAPDAKQRAADLVTLRAWYEDWSETARALITRREHLIRLGLAKRKKGEKRAEGSEEEDAPEPEPVNGPGSRPAPVARPVTPRPDA